MTMAEAISRRLDEYLFERKLTLYSLAKKAGLPTATLQNLYRGKMKSPTVSVLFKICAALEITVAEFLNSHYFDPNILELE